MAVHILDAFEDGVAALRVHGHGRLVEEDELGLVRDAACDVQATQQAAREFPRAELLVVLQADERDGLVNKVAALRAVVHIQRAEVVDVLAHGQLLEHGHVLRHHADAPLQVVARRLHVLAEQADGALVVGEQLQHAVDGRGLARAVGAQKAEHLARRDVQAEMVERDHVAVALHQVVDRDDVFHGGSPYLLLDDASIMPGLRPHRQ